MIWLVAASVLLGGFWILLVYLQRQTLKRGQLEVANKTQDGVIKEVEAANAVRDRFKSDPAYRERLKKRFERDE